ncbi:hypothetical protein LOD99_5408 [Oopsacas minuta]|uniref:Uncharacterized protein n=1 Tax=Oopsacas minuta TaxID=111878 RepID=A0AAV7JQT8_9METZ|nr:hypothetical protein LOD99_5408 [Oopsacas minuta]
MEGDEDIVKKGNVRDHISDCYFCMANISGFNAKTKSLIKYPNLHSAIRPVPHSIDVPVPTFTNLDVISEIDDCETRDSLIREDEDFIPCALSRSNSPQLFNQSELNDLVRDSDIPKESAELLGFRLKEKTCFSKKQNFTHIGTERSNF